VNVADGVLSNDTDVEGDAKTAEVVTNPAHGTLTLNANGSFTYTPAPNFSGRVSFSYRANDGVSDSNVTTVTIDVTPANDVPVANADSYGIDEDSVLNVAPPGVLGNDTDADGNPPVAALLESPPASGTLVLNTDGSFTYTPIAKASGPVSFSYRASDGAASSSPGTVTITVLPIDDAPVAGNDSYSTPAGVPLNVVAPGVLGNDTDIDNATLTAILGSGPAGGTLTLNPNGSFSYTPNPGFSGEDTFAYRANDGTRDSNLATVTINVTTTPNTAPIANADNYSTSEGTTLIVAASGVLGNDTDIDGNPLTAILVSGPASGSLTLNANGSFSYTPAASVSGIVTFSYKANDGLADSSAATVSITITAANSMPVANADTYCTNEDTTLNVVAPGVLGNDTDADGNPLTAILVSGPASGSLTLNANGSFSFTPATNASGTVTFTYKANDGSADSNAATVSITIAAENDAPVANADTYGTNENTTLDVVAPGVLANDTDIDGNSLTAILVSGPASGSLTLNANGSFSYTPAADASGTVTFTYKANDGSPDSNVASVTIDVSPTNDAPAANADSYSTNEDTTLGVAAPGVLGNDTEADANTLTARLVTGPASGRLRKEEHTS
jgi:VCBS repeat-containing protein